MHLSGYEIGEEIGVRGEHLLYRARRESDGRPVLLKAWAGSSDSVAHGQALLARELEIGRELDVDGVLVGLELVENGGEAVLVLADAPGATLDRILRQQGGSLPVTATLLVGVRLASLLSSLHRRDLVHRDLRPANIVYEEKSGRVSLTGLGRASRVPRQAWQIRAPDRLEGDPAYLAPEATGRLNRQLDYRGDLYSLGVVLFEMLTGRLPFDETDPSALVHAHIAREPPDARELLPQLPAVVSAILGKLLAKAAEDRYQSGLGLVYDLERCLADLENDGTGERPFVPGERDVPERFELPQKLFGRESEIRWLEEALVSARPVVRLVAGYSGVGKTSLIEELRLAVLRRRGWFASGTFDPRSGASPYEGVLTALRGLVAQKLGAKPEEVSAWERRLVGELGANLGVMTEALPMLASLVPDPPPVAEVPPENARNRFCRSVGRFLATFVESGRPLVLFLDDLQWADPASLELLETLLTGDGSAFLLVGAYRDNEVDEDHLLLRMLVELSARSVDVDTLRLSPLAESAVIQLVAETLHLGASEATPLAELVYRKTAGNPFFVRTFLRTLYLRRLLRFEAAALVEGTPSRWTWDLEGVATLEAAESVIELVAQRLTELPAVSRRILGVASVLGKEIDAGDLAAVSDVTALTEEILIEACREGLLVKVGASSWAEPAAETRRYAFIHDRVREGAYELVGEEERAEVHLRIGRLLRDRVAEGRDRDVFEIADHLNRAAHRLTDVEERRELVRLDAEAGRRARASGAFPTSFTYFQHALDLLETATAGTDPWNEDYELTRTLYAEAAEAALLAHDPATAERLAAILLDNARHLLDAVPAYETRIAIRHARREEHGALNLALEVLGRFGVEIPPQPEAADLRAAVLSADRAAETVLAEVRKHGVEVLPEMCDPAHLLTARLLALVSLIAGWARARLMRLASCRLLELTTAHGVGPISPIAWLFMAEVRCSELEDLAGGRRAGELALELVGRDPAGAFAARAQALFDLVISGRTLHPKSLWERFEKNYRRALESGDLLLAATSGYQISVAAMLAGTELAEAEAEARAYHTRVHGFGQLMFAGAIESLAGLAAALVGRGTVEEAIHSSQIPPEAAASVRTRVIGPEMMVLYLLRQRSAALKAARESLAMPNGMVPLFPFDFYRCLIFLEAAPEEPELRACQARLEAQAEATPELYEHRRDLVAAHGHRAAGRSAEALKLYERSAQAARDNRFPQEEALARELAGELYEELGRHREAVASLGAAVAAYRDWGARAKIDQLYETHPDLLPSTAAPSAALDVASLERAQTLLQTELDLAKLLRRLIALLIQNAGARKGYLLRAGQAGESRDRIVIEAIGCIDGTSAGAEVHLPEDLALDAESEIAATIVRFVARTQETVGLGEAASDPRFAADPYIQRRCPRSVLCFPLLHRGQTVEIVYLENDRSPDVFSTERSGAVRLLASQAAAALENARLHHSLKLEVETRRRAEAELATLKDRLEAENVYLQEEIQSHFEEIVGESTVMRRVLYKVEQVAATDATVLILGETGTGKELIARALHRLSPRRERPLVKVNCAALPATLIESELFGHEKGAFTGAVSRKSGRFELADTGTLFLDEVGDLPLELQAKLLRVLQEGELERLGGSRTLKVDVRIIAATNRDLERAISDGSFRSDLYYRLTVFPIELPPLRERDGDIPLLAHYFVGRKRARLGSQVGKIPQSVMERLVAYPWPGNVRELENVIERALILSPTETLSLEASFGRDPVTFETSSSQSRVPAAATDVTRPEAYPAASRHAPGSPEHLAELERERIRGVLENCGWKIKGKGNAAEQLGFKPSTLRDRMKKLGLVRPSHRNSGG